MHHAGKALRDLVGPGVQQGQHLRVSGFCCGKDGTSVCPGRVLLLCGTHKGSGGGVALPAAGGPTGAGYAVQCVGAVVAQLAAQAPGTFQQSAAGQDAAAHAGAQRHTDDVGIALCPADPHFPEGHAVSVVGHRDGQAKVLLQRGLDGAADVVGEIAAGTGHDALAAVDLAGGGHADAGKVFHRDGLCC